MLINIEDWTRSEFFTLMAFFIAFIGVLAAAAIIQNRGARAILIGAAVVIFMFTVLFMNSNFRREGSNTNTATLKTPTPANIENKTINSTNGNNSENKPTVARLPAAQFKERVERALKLKGFNNVVVDAATKPATIRGSVPKGKIEEAIQIAQAAAEEPVKSEIYEQ